MAAKLKITSRSVRAIRHVGPVAPPVGPETIAQALGAEIVPRENVQGSPNSLFAFRKSYGGGFAQRPGGRHSKEQPRSRRFC